MMIVHGALPQFSNCQRKSVCDGVIFGEAHLWRGSGNVRKVLGNLWASSDMFGLSLKILAFQRNNLMPVSWKKLEDTLSEGRKDFKFSCDICVPLCVCCG